MTKDFSSLVLILAHHVIQSIKHRSTLTSSFFHLEEKCWENYYKMEMGLYNAVLQKDKDYISALSQFKAMPLITVRLQMNAVQFSQFFYYE